MKAKACLILFVSFVALTVVGFGPNAHAQMVGVTLPSTPTGLTATAIPPSQISISWTGSTENSGTIEDYFVYRNGQQVATTPGTSFIDVNLPAGVYNYAVSAYDANGNLSPQSAPASMTLTVDKMPPTTPTGVTVMGATTTNTYHAQIPVTISWNPSTDNIGVAGYYVYRDGTEITASSTSAFTATSVTDTISPGAHTYAVVAYDAAQNLSNRSTPVTIVVSVDTAPPNPPGNIVAAQTSQTSVDVTWATSTADPSGIASYQIYRDGNEIASVTGSPYADTNLSPEVTYGYSIAATDIAGNVSEQSPPVNVTIQPANGPSIPSITSATAIGTSTAQISWATDYDSLPITGYTVYRDGADVATVTSTAYLDTGLASGTYAYSLSATDVSGTVSPTSSSTEVTVPSRMPAPVAVIATPVVTSAGVPLPENPPNGEPGMAATGDETLFTQFLSFGLRDAQVQALQDFLAANGYLASANATGYFGNLTLHAVQEFQCAQNIVCAGGAGFGTVGPKTRGVLNQLKGNINGSPTSPITSSSAPTDSPAAPPSTATLSAQLQALQAELADLEKQL